MNVTAFPIQCPTCRDKTVFASETPDHVCEDTEAVPSCQASEPIMEENFVCPKYGKQHLRLQFAGMKA